MCERSTRRDISIAREDDAPRHNIEMQQSRPSPQVQRRQALGGALGGAAALVAPQAAFAEKARAGAASPFTGDFDDPQHPGCLRSVKVVGASMKPDGTRSRFNGVIVKGTDGTCKDRPERKDVWTLEGKLMSDSTIVVDFSPKGGPKSLEGKWDKNGIVFPDGNKWAKVNGGTPKRFPKDQSTLKSEE